MDEVKRLPVPLTHQYLYEIYRNLVSLMCNANYIDMSYRYRNPSYDLQSYRETIMSYTLEEFVSEVINLNRLEAELYIKRDEQYLQDNDPDGSGIYLLGRGVDTRARLLENKRGSDRCMLSTLFINDKNEIAFVYFADVNQSNPSSDVGKEEIEQFSRILADFRIYIEKETTISTAIIVSYTKISSQSNTELELLRVPREDIFSDDDDVSPTPYLIRYIDTSLLFNPLDHVFTPKHTVLSKEEARKLIRESNIHLKNMPLIDINDPIAKALLVRPGQIVKIERKTVLPETLMENDLSYRLAYMAPEEKKSKPKAQKKRVI